MNFLYNDPSEKIGLHRMISLKTTSLLVLVVKTF